jgi:hypothetical protein
MRRAGLALVVVAAAAGVAVAVGAATGSFAGSNDKVDHQFRGGGGAAIFPAGLNPLRIRGTGFHSGEHVRVVAKGMKNASPRRVTAGSKGAFFVSLGTLNGCASPTVVAIGDAGSHASTNISSFVCR